MKILGGQAAMGLEEKAAMGLGEKAASSLGFKADMSLGEKAARVIALIVNIEAAVLVVYELLYVLYQVGRSPSKHHAQHRSAHAFPKIINAGGRFRKGLMHLV